VSKIPELSERVKVSRDGSCPDVYITSVLGDIISTNITNLDNKVINQRRAMWLTPDKARNISIALAEKLSNERRIKEEKEKKKEEALNAKRIIAVRTVEVNAGAIEGRRCLTMTRTRCLNDCGLVREIVPIGIIKPYDNWIGCTVCSSWFCSKSRCIARFKKHHILCLAQNPSEEE
jgi:hypothetical protein